MEVLPLNHRMEVVIYLFICFCKQSVSSAVVYDQPSGLFPCPPVSFHLTVGKTLSEVAFVLESA